MIDQYIPCPVCKNRIPIDLHQLIKGVQFSCPTCMAAIGLAAESREVVTDAVTNLDKFKKMQPQK